MRETIERFRYRFELWGRDLREDLSGGAAHRPTQSARVSARVSGQEVSPAVVSEVERSQMGTPAHRVYVAFRSSVNRGLLWSHHHRRAALPITRGLLSGRSVCCVQSLPRSRQFMDTRDHSGRARFLQSETSVPRWNRKII